MTPLLSVIIPVFNGEKYLSEALQSVLDQTRLPCEVWVVDDGSTDRSAELAKSFGNPIQVHRQENHGAAAARNEGVSRSQGEYLAFLDADDRWSPSKLESQISAFQTAPDLDMVFGHAQQFLSPELGDELRKQRSVSTDILPAYLPGSMMVKRESFFKVGGFTKGIELAEVVDWYLRAKEKGLKSRLLPEVVLQRRIHQTNQGIQKKQFQNEYLHVLKASLDRRRIKQ